MYDPCNMLAKANYKRYFPEVLIACQEDWNIVFSWGSVFRLKQNMADTCCEK